MSNIDLIGIPAGKLALFEAQMAELIKLVSEPRPTPQIMSRKMAMAYTGHNSDSAFDRWTMAYRVVPCAHGRYQKTKLDLGLAREGGSRP